MTGTIEQEWKRVVDLLVLCGALPQSCGPPENWGSGKLADCRRKADAAVKHLEEIGTLMPDEVHRIGNLVYLACRACYAAHYAGAAQPVKPAGTSQGKPVAARKHAQQAKSRLGAERPANGRRKERA